MDPADREIRLALWKLHILHHASEGPVYGMWMLKELEEHGHQLSPGTLYPILARMEGNGWLRSSFRGASKSRKNYRITAKGLRLLERLQAEVAELHRELAGRPGSDHGNKPQDNERRQP